ncbi:NACHT domain-containing protein [Streptomyces sp. NPDC059063]|uniref:NACHT domain-containing protein n=1 Tax=unclassified Streptomyces TaxID=2593676 RepID=UPI0036B56375
MAGLGGRRRRRNWQLIGAACTLLIVASSAYAVRQILHGGLQPADTAAVLGLPLGAAGLTVAVMALRKPAEGNDAERARGWAATLAGQVEAGESAVWRQLLGDDNRRINLAYLLHPSPARRPAAAPAAGRLSGDGPATLPDIVTYYRSTRPLRLVITGDAGAGKTVLALELLLALIDGRSEDAPVPVRIPLSRWDTEHQTLPELLQQRLTEAYDWPPDLADGLVRHHLVLPVLDGLDEMDPPAPDGTPDPAAPRATAVVRALNAYQQGRDAGPLILTCRTGHYDALSAHTEVLDAARIAITPVDTAVARDYLTGRALDAARWRPLTDHLAAHPGGPLATVLSTPWRLCLTATVYHHHGNPAELLTLPGPDALDRHLLARYIPAATRTAPNPRGYQPQDVHRWLHHLTTHLAPTTPSQATGTETTDLVLHELWPLAGRTRVRVTDAVLTTLTVLTTLAFDWSIPQLRPTTAFAGAIGMVAVAAGTVAALTTGSPRRLNNPFRTPQERKDLASGLARELAIGLAAGLVIGLAVGLGYGLAIGIMFGLAAGLVAGLTRKPGTSVEARAIISSDALYGLVGGPTVGLAFGFTLGLASGFANGFANGFADRFADGFAVWFAVWLVGWLAFGCAFGFAVGAQVSHRYVAFLVCSRRRLPFRLGRFLDWAVTAGLMRYSGPAYQYRHRELQHWLRQHPEPPATP